MVVEDDRVRRQPILIGERPAAQQLAALVVGDHDLEPHLAHLGQAGRQVMSGAIVGDLHLDALELLAHRRDIDLQ